MQNHTMATFNDEHMKVAQTVESLVSIAKGKGVSTKDRPAMLSMSPKD